MANKQVTLKRVIDTSGNTDTIHPTTDWAQVESKPSTFTPTAHTHGYVTDDGRITSAATIATGDHLVIADNSQSNKVITSSITFDTSNTTEFLRKDGTFAFPALETIGDGNTKFYAWRAINNTSASGVVYYKIAHISASQSSRFQIELTGRYAGYGDGDLPNYCKILGQLNNDNNYDVWWFNNEVGSSQVVSEVGIVDDGTNGVNIWVKVSNFSEVSATAYISDGTITTYDSDSETSSAPTNYTATTEYKMWNSGNDGSGSGLDADTVDGLQASSFIRSDSTDSASGNLTFSGTTTFNNQVTIDTGTSSNALYLKGTSPTITFADDTSGADDFFLHANSNNFYILADRDGNNNVGTGYETPHPLQLEADTNIGYLFGERIATRDYVDTEVAALVDSAPGTLDTLNELAAALGDDANFSTTVTNSLAGKLNLTGGTLTGTLTTKAIAMQNFNITGVNMLEFNDPGPNEGIQWNGGNFRIYESPDNLTTNSAGNLQFVAGGQRRMTVGTDGYVYVGSTLHAPTSVTTAKVHITATNPILQLTDSDTSGSAYIDYQGGTSLKVHAGSDPIVFIAGNSEKARLTAGNGNLGIGTTNPAEKIEAVGNIKASSSGNASLQAVRISGASVDLTAQSARGVVGTSSNHDFRIKTNATDRVTVKTDGKVGIGTTSPTAVLDVNGALNLKGRAFGDSDGTNSYFKSGTSGSIFFETNGGTRGKIDTSGNFGIGTLSPAEKLEVVGSVRASDNFQKKGSGGYYLYNSSMGFRAAFYDNGTTTAIYGDGNGSTPVIHINSDLVGIGTDNPGSKLQVSSSGTALGRFFSTGNGDTHGLYININETAGAVALDNNVHFASSGSNSGSFTFATGNDERMRIQSNGNVGIGTTLAGQKLEVDGNINANELHLNDTNTILKEASSGNSVRIQTNSGYVDVGPKNTGWSHFDTDRGRFYFNKGVDTNGDLRMYSNNTTKIENSTGYIYELGTRVSTWKEIKTGSTTVSSGTAQTAISLSESIDDTTVIAFELNSGSVENYTSQIFITKIEDSNNSSGGILFNALAHNSSINVGSVRVFRTTSMGPTSTSVTFTYSFKFTNGSFTETADTIYIGKIWKLSVTGA